MEKKITSNLFDIQCNQGVCRASLYKAAAYYSKIHAMVIRKRGCAYANAFPIPFQKRGPSYVDGHIKYTINIDPCAEVSMLTPI